MRVKLPLRTSSLAAALKNRQILRFFPFRPSTAAILFCCGRVSSVHNLVVAAVAAPGATAAASVAATNAEAALPSPSDQAKAPHRLKS